MRLTRSTTILSIVSIVVTIIGILAGVLQFAGNAFVYGIIYIISSALFYAFTQAFIELIENVVKIRRKLYHEDEG